MAFDSLTLTSHSACRNIDESSGALVKFLSVEASFQNRVGKQLMVVRSVDLAILLCVDHCCKRSTTNTYQNDST